MNFADGKSYEEALHSSETHKIPFQKDHLDFFVMNIDDVKDSEVNFDVREIRNGVRD